MSRPLVTEGCLRGTTGFGHGEKTDLEQGEIGLQRGPEKGNKQEVQTGLEPPDVVEMDLWHLLGEGGLE